MKMTKEQFANFRTEIESALSDIATKYGCIVEAGNIKYDDICTTVSVAFKTETAEKWLLLATTVSHIVVVAKLANIPTVPSKKTPPVLFRKWYR